MRQIVCFKDRNFVLRWCIIWTLNIFETDNVTALPNDRFQYIYLQSYTLIFYLLSHITILYHNTDDQPMRSTIWEKFFFDIQRSMELEWSLTNLWDFSSSNRDTHVISYRHISQYNHTGSMFHLPVRTTETPAEHHSLIRLFSLTMRCWICIHSTCCCARNTKTNNVQLFAFLVPTDITSARHFS